MICLSRACLSVSFLALIACGGGGGSALFDDVPLPPPTNSAPNIVISPSAETGMEGRTLTLDGSGTNDADGDSLTFEWVQLSGRSALIETPDTAVTDIRLPEVDADETLTFELSVSDGTNNARMSISITVENFAPSPLANLTFENTATLTLPLSPVDLHEGRLRTFVTDDWRDPLYILGLDDANGRTEIMEYFIDDIGVGQIVRRSSDQIFQPIDAKLENSSSFFTIGSVSRSENAVTFVAPMPNNGDYLDMEADLTVDAPCSISSVDIRASGTVGTYLIGKETGLERSVVLTSFTPEFQPESISATSAPLIDTGRFCDVDIFRFLPDPLTFDWNAFAFDNDSNTASFIAIDGVNTFPEVREGATLNIRASRSLDIGALTGLDIIDIKPMHPVGIFVGDGRSKFLVLANDGQPDGDHVLARVSIDASGKEMDPTVGSDERRDIPIGEFTIDEAIRWTGGRAISLETLTDILPDTDQSLIAIVDPTLPFLRLFTQTIDICSGSDPQPCVSSISMNAEPEFIETKLGAGELYPSFTDDVSGFFLTFPEASQIQQFTSRDFE